MTFHELPDDPFTEIPLSAGASKPFRREFQGDDDLYHEVESNVTYDDLIQFLVQGIANSPIDVAVIAPGNPPISRSMEIEVLDGQLDEPAPTIHVRLGGSAIVSVTFLIAAIRNSGIPLLTENSWLSWDSVDQCLRSEPDGLKYQWWRNEAFVSGEKLLDEEAQAVKILYRALWSTDHGKKPVLLHRDFVAGALLGREVKFLRPHNIKRESVSNYALAYYDCNGSIITQPLERLISLGYPIVTRSGSYHIKKGDVVSRLNEGKLLAGAFRMATHFNPNDFEWYLVRDRGTVFHSVIERIEPPRDANKYRCEPSLTFSAETDIEAIQTASKLVDIASRIGAIYLTSDGHPTEASFVTTPQHYLHAINTLVKHGYFVEYDRYRKTPIVLGVQEAKKCPF